MPTITIHLSAEQKAELEMLAASEGVSVSDYVRPRLEIENPLDSAMGDVLNQLEQIWGRLERLERLANLD